MFETTDEEWRQPIGAALTIGSVGRLGAAVYDLQAFAKRADSLLAKISELNARIAALEAEQPPRPRIYREAAR
jgi:hypothetical protein